MKKSFKKAIAILLAVMMVVCAFPMSAFAADEAKPNVNIRLGAFTSDASDTHYYKIDRNHAITGINAISGINSTALDYTGTAITGYGVGDYFTATVVLENVSQIAAAQIAVKYSDTIEPAGVLSGTAGFYSGSTTATPYATYVAGEAIAAQSGDALYNATHTVGELSYAADGVMYADFAVQDGSDYATSSTGYFYLATFAFKIVKEGDITFSMVDDATVEDAFFLGTLENGAQEEEYVTFVETENEGSKGLGFMGKDADGESVIPTKSYTITFVDAEGATISTGSYNEGATVTAPELPSTTKDADNHYTYAWDVTPAATATADATYTVVKTPAAHTWNTGVETIPATEETEGEMTYTCTVCSQTKTEPIEKLPAAHTHEYVWVYNNDATYTGSSSYTDGTATGTCSCGDTKTKTIVGTGLLRANQAAVTLGAAVTLNIRFAKDRDAKFAETYCVVTFNKNDYKLDNSVRIQDPTNSARWQYDFDKVEPQFFGDNLVLTMYGVTEDGIVCKGHSVNYSIMQYCTSTLAKSTTNATLKKLLVEILYYGQADYEYRANKTSVSPISGLTSEQKALHTEDVPSYTKMTEANYRQNPLGTSANKIAFKSLSLLLEGKVIPQVRVLIPTGDDLANYRFVFEVDGKTTEVSYDKNPDCFIKYSTTAEGTQYWVNFTEMDADQFSTPFYCTVFEGETQVSNTLRYSVESYATSNAYNGSAPLRKLVDQILRYGRADQAYTGYVMK